MEGALKLKEISYIHAEAYAAAELKHGPLALVDEDMPVVAVAPNNELLEKLKSNLQEVRARGGQLFVFADPDAGMQSADGVTVIQMPVAGQRAAGAGGVRRSAAIARLSRGGSEGYGCRSAAQSGQESDGRVARVPDSAGRRAAQAPNPCRAFGPEYFRKFYLNPRTRVTTAGEMRARARLIAAILAQAGIPVRTILDAGCGIGLLRKPFAEVLPRARYTGLDASEYLCARYGWVSGLGGRPCARAIRSTWSFVTTCCSISTIATRRAQSPISRD